MSANDFALVVLCVVGAACPIACGKSATSDIGRQQPSSVGGAAGDAGAAAGAGATSGAGGQAGQSTAGVGASAGGGGSGDAGTGGGGGGIGSGGSGAIGGAAATGGEAGVGGVGGTGDVGGAAGAPAGSGGGGGAGMGATGGNGGAPVCMVPSTVPEGATESCCEGSACHGACTGAKCACEGIEGGCWSPGYCCIGGCTAASFCGVIPPNPIPAPSDPACTPAPKDPFYKTACCGGVPCQGHCVVGASGAPECQCAGLVGGCLNGTLCCWVSGERCASPSATCNDKP